MTKKRLLPRLLALVILLPLAAITIDAALSRLDFRPIFVVRTAIYKDGGTTDYKGLGYRVRDYNRLDGRDDVVFRWGRAPFE